MPVVMVMLPATWSPVSSEVGSDSSDTLTETSGKNMKTMDVLMALYAGVYNDYVRQSRHELLGVWILEKYWEEMGESGCRHGAAS